MLKLYTLKTRLTFGKYNGKKIKKIAKNDPNYLVWCCDNIDGFSLSKSSKKLVEEHYHKQPEPPYRHRNYGYNQKADYDYDDPVIWDNFGQW